MADAILAMRMVRKSITNHGHLEAMIDFDGVKGQCCRRSREATVQTAGFRSVMTLAA